MDESEKMTDYRICRRCVMDTSDEKIRFDETGLCNYCLDFDKNVAARFLSDEEAEQYFQDLFGRIRQERVGHRYDCLLGISGGCDSSYTAWLAMKHGLRVLLVHMDNSWDSELSVRNIQNIVRVTGYDYENIVIDWQEFRDLQRAYFLAGVIDIEVVTDHALRAVAFRLASKHKIRHILRGTNPTMESCMPPHWGYEKNDLANLLAIHDRYGTVPLKTYPTLGLYRILYYSIVEGIEEIMPLQRKRFRPKEAKRILREVFDWKDPGQKHFESIFTRFYQGYILPRKFGVDKRRAHFSNAIHAGEMTRQEALERLSQEVYNPDQMKADYQFVVKKLGFEPSEFEALMASSPVPHSAFPTDRLSAMQWAFLTLWQIPRRIKSKMINILR